MVSCIISFHMERNVILTTDEKEEFLNLVRLNFFYTNKMKEHHLLADDMPVQRVTPDMVNPFYGRVEKGSAYVTEYSRGVPSMLYSTLGAMEIPAAKLCRGYLDDYKAFQSDVNKILGQLELQPMIKNRMDVVGPRYEITNMPWLRKDQTLPLQFKPQDSIPNRYLIDDSKEEDEYVAMLCRYAEHFFRAMGHAEIMGVELENQVEPVKPVQAPKKRFCTITGQIKHLLKNSFQHGVEKND